jgi:hypothetical protein
MVLWRDESDDECILELWMGSDLNELDAMTLRRDFWSCGDLAVSLLFWEANGFEGRRCCCLQGGCPAFWRQDWTMIGQHTGPQDAQFLANGDARVGRSKQRANISFWPALPPSLGPASSASASSCETRK